MPCEGLIVISLESSAMPIKERKDDLYHYSGSNAHLSKIDYVIARTGESRRLSWSLTVIIPDRVIVEDPM